MGGTSSKDDKEWKNIDTAGQVNNNIVIQQQEAKDIHAQLKINDQMLTIMFAMFVLEVIKFILYVFFKFKKNLKKRYSVQSVQSKSSS